MKTLKIIALLSIISFCLYGQTHHISTSGYFFLTGYSVDDSFIETHTINATGESYLRIEASGVASEYGSVEIEVRSSDLQTLYGSLLVDPYWSGTTDSETMIFDIPNDCAIILTVIEFSDAVISYTSIDNPTKVHYYYDQAGNRTGRYSEHLYTSAKKSAYTNVEFISKIEENVFLNKEFKVYPNPTTQNVFISLNEDALKAENNRIMIFDNLGKKLVDKEVFEEIEQFDLSSFKSGTYIIRLSYSSAWKQCILIKE